MVKKTIYLIYILKIFIRKKKKICFSSFQGFKNVAKCLNVPKLNVRQKETLTSCTFCTELEIIDNIVFNVSWPWKGSVDCWVFFLEIASPGCQSGQNPFKGFSLFYSQSGSSPLTKKRGGRNKLPAAFDCGRQREGDVAAVSQTDAQNENNVTHTQTRTLNQTRTNVTLCHYFRNYLNRFVWTTTGYAADELFPARSFHSPYALICSQQP